MAENLTPREIVKGLLQGVLPPRPLILPIVFSLAARLEHLPLRAFLGNPSKISNSLKQIHNHLRSDGVACYFDPYLEAEALGGTLHWEKEDQWGRICWPRQAAKGELPQGLRSSEEASKSGRVGVAVEVIRQLKWVLRDQTLLMAAVTGPFTLATRITQLEHEETLRGQDVPEAALELAASVIHKVSVAFVEAGANVIFIQEDLLPTLSAEGCQGWALLLAPVFNVIRFYQALPVLLLADSRSVARNCEVISQEPWDRVLCPALDAIRAFPLGKLPDLKAAIVGLALPLEAFQPEELGRDEPGQFPSQAISELQPAILTTPGDLPAGTDMKEVRRTFQRSCR
jgi:Uroporphyrinogen decarboxylase (URO-D)